MNFCNTSPTQRILEWRDFRNSLTNITEEQQLKLLTEFWSKAPLQTYVLDWDRPNLWPKPWDLLHEGNFDTNVIAILMEQTLILAGWDSSRLKLMYIKDRKISDQMMILLVDDKWALNYSFQEVFDYDKIKSNCIAFAKYQIQNNKRVEL